MSYEQHFFMEAESTYILMRLGNFIEIRFVLKLCLNDLTSHAGTFAALVCNAKTFLYISQRTVT